jgi:hypothetical protein
VNKMPYVMRKKESEEFELIKSIKGGSIALVFAVIDMENNSKLTVRSNSSKSSGLKSRPGNCPYAPVV